MHEASLQWKGTSEEIMSGIVEYAGNFIGACHDFMLMLWKKKVAEHVY
ncbi:MAG: hypothetical protein ACKVRN_07280 [Pyrinomonadaceae bacterium]